MSETADVTWNGLTWKQMPGGDRDTQRMNFALFRRGLLSLEEHEMDEVDGRYKKRKKGNPFGDDKRRRLEALRQAEEAREAAMPLGRGSVLPQAEINADLPPASRNEPLTETNVMSRTTEISADQQELKRKFDAVIKPAGWLERFRTEANISSSTLWKFQKDQSLLPMTLAKVKNGLDTMLILPEAEAARGHEAPEVSDEDTPASALGQLVSKVDVMPKNGTRPSEELNRFITELLPAELVEFLAGAREFEALVQQVKDKHQRMVELAGKVHALQFHPPY